MDFLDQVIKRIPFPIQRIQTDRGQEFFAYVVQGYLRERKIKFRPIKPLYPHLNGKVERTQRTDLDEFYSSVDPKDSELQNKLMVWEKYYNQHRVHSSLHGKTPNEKYENLKHIIPSIQEINDNYNSKKEPFAVQNYKHDQMLNALLSKKQ